MLLRGRVSKRKMAVVTAAVGAFVLLAFLVAVHLRSDPTGVYLFCGTRIVGVGEWPSLDREYVNDDVWPVEYSADIHCGFVQPPSDTAVYFVYAGHLYRFDPRNGIYEKLLPQTDVSSCCVGPGGALTLACPDGDASTRLVEFSLKTGALTDIRNLDTSYATNLSRAGDIVAFAQVVDARRVYVADLAGSVIAVGPGSSPQLLDKRTLVYQDEEEVVIYDVEKQRVLRRFAAYSHSLSPTRDLLYVSGKDAHGSKFADILEVKRNVDDVDISRIRSVDAPEGLLDLMYGAPGWSSDGGELLFVGGELFGNRSGEVLGERQFVYVYSLEMRRMSPVHRSVSESDGTDGRVISAFAAW